MEDLDCGGGLKGDDLGALILKSVSKKTTHRVDKTQRFYLWFFLPLYQLKIWIFRGFLQKVNRVYNDDTERDTNKQTKTDTQKQNLGIVL